LAKVDAVAKLQQRVWRRANIEQSNPSARANNAGQFGKRCVKVTKISQGKPAGHAVNRGIREWQLRPISLNARKWNRRSLKHSKAQVYANGMQPASGDISREVTRAAGQINHG
jgi:hypothetical protein